MNAEEMFKKLGFERIRNDGCFIKYKKADNGIDEIITFSIMFRYFSSKYGDYTFTIPYKFDIDTFKAVIQQTKELGWFEEEQREETNLDHYKDEILEHCTKNLAVVKGKPKLCYKINCNDCDFKIVQIGCHKKVEDWLKQPYEKPKYKITQFEYDLLSVHKDYKTYNNIANQLHLFKMREKGYFKDVDTNVPINEILRNCEVIK